MKAHRIYSLLTRWQRFNGFTERERESIVELVAGIVSEAKRDDLASLRADVERITKQNAALLRTLKAAAEAVELGGLNAGFIQAAIAAAEQEQPKGEQS